MKDIVHNTIISFKCISDAVTTKSWLRNILHIVLYQKVSILAPNHSYIKKNRNTKLDRSNFPRLPYMYWDWSGIIQIQYKKNILGNKIQCFSFIIQKQVWIIIAARIMFLHDSRAISSDLPLKNDETQRPS